MSVPRCSARRRDGQPCGALASSPDAVFCRHHEDLADVHGDDAVREGRYPRSRSPQTESPIVETETNGRNGSTAVGPADVRPALAQAAASSLDEIQQALLDAALGAAREHWATFTCPNRGKKHRAQVNVPDVRSRVAAIELLLREGLGRPAQAEEPHHAALPATAAAVKRMSWSDLQAVFALEFAEEIETVASGDAAPSSGSVSANWVRRGAHCCAGRLTSSTRNRTDGRALHSKLDSAPHRIPAPRHVTRSGIDAAILLFDRRSSP